MPDGTVPSTSEALRSALAAAQASLQRQIQVSRSDAAEDALRQVQSALSLLPQPPPFDIDVLIAEADWSEAEDLALIEATAPSLQISDTSRADDLTRIRGIDEPLAKRLAAIGIQRFAQVAGWQPEDVRAIADAMGLGRRFIAMGVVDQAASLERQRIAALDRQLERPKPVTAESRQTVAKWTPSEPLQDATARLVPQPPLWRPIDGADLMRVRAAVGAKHPMNRLVQLARLAPALDQPIFIATDYNAAIEVPRWQTGVLVPFVAPPDAPDLSRLSHDRTAIPAPAAKPAPLRTIIQSAPLPAPRMDIGAGQPVAPKPAAVDVPTAPAPLYEATNRKIEDLESEIATITAPQPVEQRGPSGDAATEPPTKQHAPLAPVSELDFAVDPADYGQLADIEEADVKIVVATQAKAPMLAPLPDLPLSRTRRAGGAAPSDADAPPLRGGIAVEEAAVIIVRRSAEPVANALPFYAVPKAEPVNPLRRFMRALAGG